ncbi:MAG: SPOR domain-containing protein [Desulfovibrionaceae bacterium]
MDIEKKQDKDKAAPRKYTFQLSRVGIACVATGAMIALVWVFVFGVLVGRGYHPENSVPELARIIPGPPQTSGDDVAPQQAAPPAKVIPAEELQFPKALKDNTPPAVPAAPAAPAKATPPAPAEAKKKSAAQPAAPATATADAPGSRFAYIYQVASFRQMDQAQDMARRLKSAGLATTIESATSNGSTWYRLLVHMKGRPEDTRALKATLTEAGLGKPMLRSKNPL